MKAARIHPDFFEQFTCIADKCPLSYEDVRDYMVVISRMTGNDEEDVREYLENSFETLVWDWGYFALIVGNGTVPKQ
ncbi:MAG: hypothetical protein ACI4FX_02005 [Agathobacter sp.]